MHRCSESLFSQPEVEASDCIDLVSSLGHGGVGGYVGDLISSDHERLMSVILPKSRANLSLN